MNKPRYHLAKTGEFVIENYNSAPTFSSFFPGIAGIFGCPLWVFYANRGQCITSAGVQDKNGAIIEFQPANKAYRTVSLNGFRTFLKIDGKFYEPFSERTNFKREMRILPESLKLVEENPQLKVRVEVTYFTVPNESFPALARIVRVSSLSKKRRAFEILDGLPAFIPYGFDNDLLKKISQTIEAWCTVENPHNGAPFCKLKVAPADVAETKTIDKGNFFMSLAHQAGQDLPAELIVNPSTVFAENSSLELPARFVAQKHFQLPPNQPTEGFTPCAFAYKKLSGDFELYTIIGQVDSIDLLNNLRKKISCSYLEKKQQENQELINAIGANLKTASASPAFDGYARYTFLDNIMRGGLPLTIGEKVFYAYYRKHGDMERDYNDFKLMPTYFSQGNGNYRDINQNRRNDLFFNPAVGEENVRRFFNLLQLDGFNPLVVLGSQFYLKSATQADAFMKKHLHKSPGNLAEKLTKPFLLGNLLKELEQSGVAFRTSREEFAKDLLAAAEVEEDAVHGEGFWIDHPFYNTDLLESYSTLYPEKLPELLLKKKLFTFYDNDHVVLPRSIKYKLVNGRVRQYNSVQTDVEKRGLINRRLHHKNVVRIEHGNGKLYYTTLIGKLFCIVANKVASFDAEGIGLEMEAGKPDWYDALNGLPGLLGSSLSETLELKRLALYILEHFPGSASLSLPVELKSFVLALQKKLSGTMNSFRYWDEATTLKETYRQRTRFGVSGKEEAISGKLAVDFLNKVVKKCDLGIKKCRQKYKNYYTYFINEVVSFRRISGDGLEIKKIVQRPLPLFLEGFVHALKVEKDKKIYNLVKKSPLYDKELKMYKVNAPLAAAPLEIGRARVFTPGWLENESVWLHMEYKYLLELLKAGMYSEFFADFKNVLIPFLDPQVYKRSILENSSFIVSSANPDQANHGRGFVARLSGAAAEFIDMWIIMMTGKNIFQLERHGQLCFKLAPVLPGWLFNEAGELSFTLLGSIEVTYINKKKKNTFGKSGVSPISYKLSIDEKEILISKPTVPEPYARQIRERKVKKMIVTLG